MDKNLTPKENKKPDMATEIGVECPQCKSTSIKWRVIPGFYDCVCRNCDAKFVVALDRVYGVIPYLRESNYQTATWAEKMKAFGLSKKPFIESLFLGSFIAFSILAVIASISYNSYLSYPFQVVAMVSLLAYLFGKLRARIYE